MGRLMQHRHRLAVALLLTCGTTLAQVKSEPYVWKSVTILANGFVNGIVYGQAEGGPCYINTDMGGAYRLDAKSNEWACLTDWIAHDDFSLNQMGCETIAADPTDADRVYAGLGTYMGPSAVVRSNDQGRTWQRTNVPFPMNGNGSARNSGQRMNVDPNLPSRLLYGTRTKGLYESRDSAATWAAIEAFPATGEQARPCKDTGLTWTLFDKASGKPGSATPVAFVGVCTRDADKLWRTADAGKTWQPVPGQPGGPLLPTRAALTADGKTLYATFVVAADCPGPSGVVGGAIYRCDDPAGASPTWTEISPKLDGRGGFSGVSLDPQTPGTLYVTTLCHYAGGGDDIFRTRDVGRTWSPLHIRNHRDDRSAPYAKDIGLHWTGDVQVNPHDANEAIFTTGYGLYRTTNLAADEPTWTFYNQGFEQSAVLELVSPKRGTANLISAIGDRDGYRHEDFAVSPKYGRLGQKNDFGQTKNLSMGTCNDLDVAYDQPDVCVRVGSGSQYSNDGGITWQTFPGETPRNGFAEAGGRLGPSGGTIAVAPDASSAVWAPNRQLPRVSERHGDGWTEWKDVQGLSAGVRSLAADYGRRGTFYADAADGVFVSTDGGRTFKPTKTKPPTAGIGMRATPGHAGHLWMTCGKAGVAGLWHSTDGGDTWKRVAANDIVVAKQVGLGAPPPGRDYPAVFIGGTVGQTRGFFRSDDAGGTWVRVNNDAHQYGNVTVINGDTRVFGRLYVGTNGRGIFYGEPIAPESAKKIEEDAAGRGTASTIAAGGNDPGLDMAPDTNIDVVRAAVAAIPTPLPAGPVKADWDSLKSHYRVPPWYAEAKFGLMMHWGLFSVPAYRSEWYEKHMYAALSDWHVQNFGPPETFGYKDFIPMFTAAKFDPADWADLFARSGARFVIPTAQHHDGFALWASDGAAPWNAGLIGPKRDLIGDLCKAVRARGLKFGVSNHGIENFTFINPHREIADRLKAAKADLFDPTYADFYHVADRSDAACQRFLVNWAARNVELIEKYQPDILWFDNGIDQRFLDPLKLWLAAYYYNRAEAWGKAVTLNTKKAAYAPGGSNIQTIGSVIDFEKIGGRSPGGIRTGVWDVDEPIGSTWGYTRDMKIALPRTIIAKLVDTVSKNGTLMLNLSPQADGTIDRPQRDTLLAVGDWLKVNGEAIYGTHSWTKFAEGGGRDAKTPRIHFTVKGDALYAIVLGDWPGGAVTIHSLNATASVDGEVREVTLLGRAGRLAFQRDADGLTVTLPPEPPCAHAYVLKIVGLKTNASTTTPDGNPLPDQR